MSAVLSARREGITVVSESEPNLADSERGGEDTEGTRVNGVEYGGSEGGRNDESVDVGSERVGERRWKSSWISGGSARWKWEGGRSWRTTFCPLLLIEFIFEDEIGDRDVLEVPLLDEVSAHGIGDEEVRICGPPEVGLKPGRGLILYV